MPKILTAADFNLGSNVKADDTPNPAQVPNPEAGPALSDDDKAMLIGGPDGGLGPKEDVVDSKKSEDKEGSDTKKKEGDKPTYKYANQDEAEKAAKESEKRMHKATEEAARLRKMVLDQNLGNRNTPTDRVSEEDEISDRALAEVAKLKEDDPEYQKKTMRIWAKAQREIAKLEVQGQSKAAQEKASTDKALTDTISQALKDSGLDTEWDQNAFYVLANYVPKNIEDQDEQIEWVIGQIQEYRVAIIEGYTKKTDEEKEAQKKLKVLGSGSNSKGDPVVTKPTEVKKETLGDAMKRLRAGRTVSAGK